MKGLETAAAEKWNNLEMLSFLHVNGDQILVLTVFYVPFSLSAAVRCVAPHLSFRSSAYSTGLNSTLPGRANTQLMQGESRLIDLVFL